MVVSFILQMLRDELGLEEGEIHPRSRFEALGVDSKRALEFKELLEDELGCALRTTLLFDYPTPESMGTHVVRVAFGGEADAPAGAAPTEQAGAAEASPAGEATESAEERLRKKLSQYNI